MQASLYKQRKGNSLELEEQKQNDYKTLASFQKSSFALATSLAMKHFQKEILRQDILIPQGHLGNPDTTWKHLRLA